jgi:hypothetical protein
MSRLGLGSLRRSNYGRNVVNYLGPVKNCLTSLTLALLWTDGFKVAKGLVHSDQIVLIY